MDLNKAYILDPTKPGERDAWVEGYLETDDPNISSMTLYHYEHYRKRSIEGRPEFNREVALAKARAKRDIFDHVASRTPSKKKKMPTKLARFVTDGRKASDHVRGSRISPDDSELPIGSHDHQDPTLLSPPPDERGPYRGRSPSPVARIKSETPVTRVDTEMVITNSRRVQPTLPAPDTTPMPRPKMVVKMRET
jgi:putative transposase